MNRPRLLVSWRARHESASANAARMGKLLTDLAEIDACLGRWYKKAMSREAAFRASWQMPPNVDELTKVFEKANHRDLDGKITDMALGAWNGLEEGKPASLSFFGNKGQGGNQLMPNTFQMVLPSLLSDGDPMPVAAYRKILCSVVEAWDADFGYIDASGYTPVISEIIRRPSFWGGWMSYFTAEFASWFEVPPGIPVYDGPAGGQLIQLTEEPFDEENPAHRGAAEALYRTLATAFVRLPTFGVAKVCEARALLGWDKAPPP